MQNKTNTLELNKTDRQKRTQEKQQKTHPLIRTVRNPTKPQVIIYMQRTCGVEKEKK